MSKNIHEAINAVMNEVGYVKKQKSPNLNYTFAGEAALIAALRPAMVEQGITVRVSDVYDIVSREYTTKSGAAMVNVTLTAKITFTHSETLTETTVTARGEGSDSGDKANNKAMTCAYKYALRQTFMIETGDDPDRDIAPRYSQSSEAGENEKQEREERKAEPKAQAQGASAKTSASEFDPTEMVNVLDGKTVNLIISLKLSENTHSAAPVLAKYPSKRAPLGKIVAWFSQYRENKNAGMDTEAAILAATETMKGN